MIIGDKPISEYELVPRCEHCRSDRVAHVGKIGISGNQHDAYRCTGCGKTSTGLSQGKKEALAQLGRPFNIPADGISWINNNGTITGTTGITTGASNHATMSTGTWNGTLGGSFGGGSLGGVSPPMQTSDQQLKMAIDNLNELNRQTNAKLDSINSNLFMVVQEIQKLLKKIDDANLTNPLTNVLNRVKNFELK